MKKINFGQTITILANVGVIAGIGLLALELAQNNELLTAEARSTRAGIRNEVRIIYLENPDLIDVLYQARRQETLTEEENYQLRSLMAITMNNLQYVYVEYQEGLISEEDLGVFGWRRLYHNQYPDMPALWAEIQGAYRTDFVEFFEENVVNQTPESEFFF
jgi:hypothetical protein